MARLALSLLALFLCATYVAGHAASAAGPAAAQGNLEAVCKKTYDVNSCLQLLTPAVTPFVQFDSLEWYRKVLSKSLSKTIIARTFMTRHVRGLEARQQVALMNCVEKMSASVELLQQVSREYVELYKAKTDKGFLYGWHKKNVQALLGTATADHEACRMILERQHGPMMEQVKNFADNAYNANKIVSEIVLAD